MTLMTFVWLTLRTKGEMNAQVTHQYSEREGRLIQLVSPAHLREVLDEQGADYSRPVEWEPGDEWWVEDEPQGRGR
ncbi:MAG: hypothetical protein KGL39_29370 [Patescibacteria group bacterium]|nr:hypothetical protein [Patescibacteria group bacterium]